MPPIPQGSMLLLLVLLSSSPTTATAQITFINQQDSCATKPSHTSVGDESDGHLKISTTTGNIPVLMDQNGQFWLGTENGVYHFPQIHMNALENARLYFPGHSILSIARDGKGGFVIGTAEHGEIHVSADDVCALTVTQSNKGMIYDHSLANSFPGLISLWKSLPPKTWAGLSIVMTLLLVYAYKKGKERNRKDLLQLKSELEHRQKKIASFSLNVIQKNALLSGLLEQMEDLRERVAEPNKERTKSIITELKSNIQKDSGWESFKRQFEFLHKDFLIKLKRQCPRLTEHEMRLCCYIRINMMPQEIARVLNISTGSVYTARYRTRKKLGLDSEEGLNAFLFSL